MNDTPRIRRASGDPPTPSNGPSIWIIALLVALVGLAIGGFASRFAMGGHRGAAIATDPPAVHVTPIPTAEATESPVETPSPSPSPTPSTHPKPSPKASPKSLPTATASAKPLPKSTVAPSTSPTSKPSPRPIVKTPQPTPMQTPRPATPTPVPPSATPLQRAESTVRAYIAALKRGDIATAESLLGAGVPTERSFITSTTVIQSLTGEVQANGRIKIDVQLNAASGLYLDTFQLDSGPNGYYIADHYASKT